MLESLTRRQIFAMWYAGLGDRRAKVKHVQNCVLQKCASESDSEDVINKRKQIIYAICNHITSRWEKCHRMKDKFLSKYSSWLDKEVSLSPDVSEETSTFQSDLPSTINYQSNSEMLKRRESTYKNTEERIYCRLCLKRTKKNALPLCLSYFNYSRKRDTTERKKLEKVKEIVKMLKFCLPFFELLTFDPIICSICVRRLKMCYNFSKECLKSQRLVEKYADIYSPNERIVSITEMIETEFTLQDGDNFSHIQTEVPTPSIPKDSRNSAQQTRRKYSYEDNAIAKRQKISRDHESQEKNLQTSSNKEITNIKIEAGEGDRSSMRDISEREIIDPNNIDGETIIKTEPNCIDSAEESDGPFTLKESLIDDIPKTEIIESNTDEETVIKIEPGYIDCADFIKTELEHELHMENELCSNKEKGSINIDFERQNSHMHRTGSVSLDKINVPLHHRYDFGKASVIIN